VQRGTANIVAVPKAPTTTKQHTAIVSLILRIILLLLSTRRVVRTDIWTDSLETNPGEKSDLRTVIYTTLYFKSRSFVIDLPPIVGELSVLKIRLLGGLDLFAHVVQMRWASPALAGKSNFIGLKMTAHFEPVRSTLKSANSRTHFNQ
jgi:hypothetical protein